MAIPFPPDICGIFFCVSKISLPEVNSGSVPVAVFAGEACPSLPRSLPLPQPSLLRGHLSPPEGTHGITPHFALLSAEDGSLSAARGGLQSGRLPDEASPSPGAGTWACGPAPVRRLGGQAVREQSRFLLSLTRNKQLRRLGR